MHINKKVREAVRAIEALGVSVESCTQNKGHFRLHLKYKNEPMLYFIGSTPSDYKSMLNMTADIRRAVKDIDEGRIPWLNKKNYSVASATQHSVGTSS